MAHNPKVVGSNPTPATKFTDSQGLVGRNQQALLLSGKDLGKKSVFPYRSQAIRFRKIPSWTRACRDIPQSDGRKTLCLSAATERSATRESDQLPPSALVVLQYPRSRSKLLLAAPCAKFILHVISRSIESPGKPTRPCIEGPWVLSTH